MPNPKKLKIGDRILFIAHPDEWARPGFRVDIWDKKFMDALIKRGRPSRIAAIDEYGNRWINVRLKSKNRYEHHTWSVTEKSGWRRLKPRSA